MRPHKVARLGTATALDGRCYDSMSVLLSFSEGAHWNIVLFEPARNRIGVAPLIFSIAVDSSDLNGAKLLLNILLYEPISILIQLFGSQCLSHMPPLLRF